MATKDYTYRDIDLDFLAHPLSKDIVKVSDDNAVKQSVENLLTTGKFTVPMQPERGSDVLLMLFEPMGPDTVIELREAIIETLERYEPRININEVQVKADYDNGTYDVKIIFQILNNIDLSVIEFVLTKVN